MLGLETGRGGGAAGGVVGGCRLGAGGVLVLGGAVSSGLGHGGPAAAPTRRDVGGLTPREQEVFALVTEGRSNKQIAAELSLGLRTVESHVSNLLAKLGAVSRTEAVAQALRSASAHGHHDDETLGS